MRVKYKCELRCDHRCIVSAVDRAYLDSVLRCVRSGSDVADWSPCRTILNALKIGYLRYYRYRHRGKV